MLTKSGPRAVCSGPGADLEGHTRGACALPPAEGRSGKQGPSGCTPGEHLRDSPPSLDKPRSP